ncbi:MAG: tetratricopeptide repeat protein [Chloroflexota bacterium]
MDPVAQELEEARNAILSSAYPEAVAACRTALTKCPKHVEVTTLLAEAYREMGLLEQAEDLLRRVLSADPENVLAHWALGLLLSDRERESDALASLNHARELAPGNPEILADLQNIAGDRRAAAKPTRGMLGRIYLTQGLYGRAAEEFRAVLAVDRLRLDVWVALARALWLGRESDEAAAVCEAILAESPDCVQALLLLARARHQDGQNQEAERLLARAVDMDPAGTIAARLL